MYSPHCAVSCASCECVTFCFFCERLFSRVSATAAATVAAPNDDLFCTHTHTLPPQSSKRCSWCEMHAFTRLIFSLIFYDYYWSCRFHALNTRSRSIEQFFAFSAHKSNMRINAPRFYCVLRLRCHELSPDKIEICDRFICPLKPTDSVHCAVSWLLAVHRQTHSKSLWWIAQINQLMPASDFTTRINTMAMAWQQPTADDPARW